MSNTIKPYVIAVNEEVRLLAEFVEKSFPLDRRVGVVQGLSALAPALWCQIEREELRAIRVRPPSPMPTVNVAQIPRAST